MDWIAAIFELCGDWVVGNKRRLGFVLKFICGLCWITYVITSKSAYGLLLVVIPALAINVRNFIRWSKCDTQS